MSDSNTSGMRPDRDFDFLSNYLQNTVRSYHSDFIRQVQKGEPAPDLFHYTTLKALEGVITGHDLWLTHALYCNDEAELKLGRECARKEIRKLCGKDGDEIRKHYSKGNDVAMLAYLNDLDALIKQPSSEEVYICCFCENGDALSQWRAYGGNGNGVSIRIPPNRFENYVGKQPFGFLSIWNVSYPSLKHEQIMERAILHTYEQFWPSLLPEQIARKAKDLIDFFVPTFKHEGFKEEVEWRMTFAPEPSGPKPRYRAARDMLIPYYSLKGLIESTGVNMKTWSLPITEVRIGPCRYKELNEASARSLLSNNGYNCPVIPSQTPYRG
jgi:hypothetical protein